MTGRPRKKRASGPGGDQPVSEARVIPLHADESTGRTRWRLGDRAAGAARADSGPVGSPAPAGRGSPGPAPAPPEPGPREPGSREPRPREPRRVAARPEMAPLESTVPESTVPESTVPESTVPESTVPESTVPESTVPESGPAEPGSQVSDPPGSVSRGPVSRESVRLGSGLPGPGSPEPGLPGSGLPGSDLPGSGPQEGPPPPSAGEEALVELLAFLRRRAAGEYAVDDFGFDTDLTDNVVLPALRLLYQRWFRVETIGMHHVPDTGGALLVANHSGTLPLDSLMLEVAVHDEHPRQRHLRTLGADLVFRMPVLGALARKQGSTLACNPDAERLLSDGELVGVWPEGFKGIGKPFRDRYKLQRFGRGGFVSAALRTGVPIIPCSIVGAEEIYPKIGDLKPLARLLGAPYVPVTPLFPLLGPLGLVPLPSKWYIEFGEPIDTGDLGPAAADDPMTVFNLNDQVRETIQFTLYRLLSHRRNPFLG
jgi:1-acyl-sn-glycerol-3-phosphate acyltransferase